MRRPRSPRGSGDQLRGEIISAATDLLVGKGDDAAVSIRAVAARVGVTPPSIYLHFADKEALLDAVTAHYFEHLDDVLDEAMAAHDDALDRGLALGLAYVRFAVATPVLYQLAFARASAAQGSMVDEVLASAAFARLSRNIDDLVGEGFYPPGESLGYALELWSAAHGVASLMIAKPHLPWGEDLQLAENVLRAVCFGRAAQAITGSRPTPDQARTALGRLRPG